MEFCHISYIKYNFILFEGRLEDLKMHIKAQENN